MHRLPTLLSGIFLVFLTSWLGLVAYPALQLGRLTPVADADNGGSLPPTYGGQAIAGQRVYATEGCISCHSQQVRQTSITSSDIDRGWGARPSVARDYLRDSTAFLGSRRLGQDLTNVGVRRPDAKWHLIHLYHPSAVCEGSLMPCFSDLFLIRKIQGQRSNEALALTGDDAPQEGYEVVPTADAKNLVAYLLSLRHDYPLPEAPVKKIGAAK
ncbi:MAG: cbb3-type cytochrome c oxidase subunit II [Verrucomicrobia bacterium]|nr:cbb3-type cytochrome c oxidase subunit II [Verrucomicrobiota bacterium]